VNGVSGGTAIISYTILGCSSTTVVTVNSLPDPIGGVGSVCVGSNIVLTDGGGGSWISFTTSVATIDADGTVTGVGPGSATIAYSLGVGCTVSATVSVDPVPAAIG